MIFTQEIEQFCNGEMKYLINFVYQISKLLFYAKLSKKPKKERKKQTNERLFLQSLIN
jgi:hypothetical protein